jgi:23S rRNA (cytidine1920-2'-O)/16S rRNA (cytidine1409-2'-O)-methyltransferase
MAKQKRRLDQLVVERYPALSRAQVQSFIMQGQVFVAGNVVTKAGTPVPADAEITLKTEKPRYVSRAGFKLEKALHTFHVDVHDKVILDAGLSTGGFTDCLLQQGAQRVYGVDVGYGLVHESLRTDPRLVVMERTNLRYLDPASIAERVDMVTLDLSFISVMKVIPVVQQILKPGGELIVLIKPQFEAGREQVGRGGIITDPQVHQEVINRLTTDISAAGFRHVGVVESPILGGSGNKEFLAYFVDARD